MCSGSRKTRWPTRAINHRQCSPGSFATAFLDLVSPSVSRKTQSMNTNTSLDDHQVFFTDTFQKEISFRQRPAISAI